MSLVTSIDSSGVIGRISEVVYVPYKGGTYIRKAPKSRKKSRTPAMLSNQQRVQPVYEKQQSGFCKQCHCGKLGEGTAVNQMPFLYMNVLLTSLFH